MHNDTWEGWYFAETLEEAEKAGQPSNRLPAFALYLTEGVGFEPTSPFGRRFSSSYLRFVLTRRSTTIVYSCNTLWRSGP